MTTAHDPQAPAGPPVSFGKTDPDDSAATETTETVETVEDTGVDWRERWQTAQTRAAQVAGQFSPPDIWSLDRPALRRVWAYATAGEWTGPDGTVRTAGRAYAVVVALPVTAAAYLIAWTAERPSRLAVAALLLLLCAQIPPLAWLI